MWKGRETLMVETGRGKHHACKKSERDNWAFRFTKKDGAGCDVDLVWTAKNKEEALILLEHYVGLHNFNKMDRGETEEKLRICESCREEYEYWLMHR